MRINITESSSKITKTDFFEDNPEYLFELNVLDVIRIYDEAGDYIFVKKESIPGLVKALEKAKEIWP